MGGAEIRLRVNGSSHSLPVAPPDRSLLGVLRQELGLTGTKYGCGEGECGACTVLLDGEPALACQVSLGDAVGKAVTTIEGLAGPGELSPVQRAFAELRAFQCGYCTPGMVVAATALLRRTPAPTRAEIVAALEPNVCRCCGYGRIVAAIERAASTSQSDARFEVSAGVAARCS